MLCFVALPECHLFDIHCTCIYIVCTCTYIFVHCVYCASLSQARKLSTENLAAVKDTQSGVVRASSMEDIPTFTTRNPPLSAAAQRIVDAVVKLYMPDHTYKYLDISPVSVLCCTLTCTCTCTCTNVCAAQLMCTFMCMKLLPRCTCTCVWHKLGMVLQFLSAFHNIIHVHFMKCTCTCTVYVQYTFTLYLMLSCVYSTCTYCTL